MNFSNDVIGIGMVAGMIWLVAGGLAATKLFPVVVFQEEATWKTWALVPIVTFLGLASLVFSGMVVTAGEKTWRRNSVWESEATIFVADGVCPFCGSVLSLGQPACLDCGQITGA